MMNKMSWDSLSKGEQYILLIKYGFIEEDGRQIKDLTLGDKMMLMGHYYRDQNKIVIK